VNNFLTETASKRVGKDRGDINEHNEEQKVRIKIKIEPWMSSRFEKEKRRGTKTQMNTQGETWKVQM
jgi:hypothetical protein